MRPRNSRKALADLSRICRENGLKLKIIRQKGKGSHQTLVFEDEKGDRSVHVVIAGTSDLSPGVQRGILRHLHDLGTRAARGVAAKELADFVRGILDAYFNS